MAESTDPHRGRPVLQAGVDFEAAKAAMILLHGRGANAADILSLAAILDIPDIAYVAPEAAANRWYPYPFVAPVEQNQPYLASALGVIAGLVERISGDGLPREKIVIAGFSQGACLALEFAARNPQRYGGVVGLSGGLIGETINAASYAGSLSGTPAFIGCSNVDPHIPLGRVEETADIFGSLGARVTLRIYPGMGHTINEDEMTSLRGIVSDAIGQEF